MVDNILDLQFVLVVGVCVAEVSEFLRQVEAVRHILWRHKVLGHLDTVVEVAHLWRVAGVSR